MPFEIYLLAIGVGIIIGSILPSGYPTFFVKHSSRKVTES